MSAKPSPWGGPRPDPDRVMRLPLARCPHCGSLNDAATGMEGATSPAPGDVAMCITCAGLSQYTAALGLAKLDETEEVLVRADPRVKRALDAWKTVKQRRGEGT